jgi:signal transduction histidine kinase
LRVPVPRSLQGQIALLVALALFLAQAINFTLLVGERRAMRIAAASYPAVTRLVDADERLNAGRPLLDDRRTWLVGRNPAPPAAARVARVEEMVARGLADAGVRPTRVIAWLRPISRDDLARPGIPRGEARRIARSDEMLTVAVEQPGRGWLTTMGAWPPTARGLVWRLAGQTLVLYGVVLLPVLWLGRRIARPLRALALAASAFRPGEPAEPVEEHGPGDVRAVIAAYNTLGDRVSAMIDEKDRMLGAIGHDLRTPLAALRVRIESVDDDADRTRMADIIDEMARTLEDILSLARLGRPSEPPVETDLGALVDAVVDDFRDLGHDIDAEDPVRLPVRVRPSQMRRAVRNLIENAIKYAGAAEVRVSEVAGGACIEVLDRGPGIPADRLSHVFDPFIRIETSRNRDTGGIGLGLALARAIVREVGGEIALANRDGGGLRAAITLPR